MTYITKESALQAIADYQGGAVDKTVAMEIIEGLPEVATADDLISRQAAIKELLSLNDQGNSVYYTKCIGDAVYALAILPSAQPEIIRCKDCKHYEIWQLKSDYTDDKRFKPSVCVLGCYAVHRSPDWYCADAERRENE